MQNYLKSQMGMYYNALKYISLILSGYKYEKKMD